MKLKMLGSQVNAATSAGSGAAFDGATVVYCVNTDTAAQLVTVCNSSNATQGSFTLAPNGAHMVVKAPSDKVFAASADVKLTPLAHHA